MVLLGVFLAEVVPGAAVCGQLGGRERSLGGCHGHRGLGPFDDLVVVDAAGSCDDEVLGEVALVVEAPQLLAACVGDDLGVAEDRAAQRVVGEDGFSEQVEDDVLRVVLVHRDLLEHHGALLGQASDRGLGDHLRDHVERALEVDVEHARVDRRRLLAGPRVQLRAHRIEDLVDLLRPVARRSPEQHVLEQVRQPRLLLTLGDRPGPDPEPQSNGAHGRHLLANDPHSTSQLSDQVVSHRKPSLQARGTRQRRERHHEAQKSTGQSSQADVS